MKRLFFILYATVCALQIQGKGDFQRILPHSADSSEPQYYRIVSACKDYTGKCLQDNTSNVTYTYLVHDFDAGNTLQQFQLIADNADTTKYYLRNRSSRKYIQNKYKQRNEYSFLQGIASKYYTSPFTITPIGQNQVLIHYTESNGITRYLNVADDASVKEKVFIEDALNSRYAWYIVDASQDITHISPAIAHEDIGISVVNRHIIVTGCPDYTIYNSFGIPQNRTGERTPGIYIIKTPQKAFKVCVR